MSLTGGSSVGLFAQCSSGSTYSSEDTSELDSYFVYDGDSSYVSGGVSTALNDSSNIAVSGENNRAVMAAATGYSHSGEITISVDETGAISGDNGNPHVISPMMATPSALPISVVSRIWSSPIPAGAAVSM